jgi:hypothetical protein
MSSASDQVENGQHSTETEKHFKPDSSTMADSEKHKEGETSQTDSEKDLQYATSFKLFAIMATINLSTMVAALDLVRSQTEIFHPDDEMKTLT